MKKGRHVKGYSLIKRFLGLVDQIPTERGCRIWLGYKHKSGYGRFYFDGKLRLAHVVAAEAFYGPAPNGYEACHSCDNPSCVWPPHISWGTRSQNKKDSFDKGRSPLPVNKKLSNQQVIEIYTATGTQKAIAAHYGVSDTTVRYIKSSKRWALLTSTLVQGR